MRNDANAIRIVFFPLPSPIITVAVIASISVCTLLARIVQATTHVRQLVRRNKARNAGLASAVIHSHNLAPLLDREIVVKTSAYASIFATHRPPRGRFIEARLKIKIFSFRDSTFEKRWARGRGLKRNNGLICKLCSIIARQFRRATGLSDNFTSFHAYQRFITPVFPRYYNRSYESGRGCF